jgi:zinc protease
LTLLRQILREPTLPAAEFEILRRQTLAQLEEQLADPQSLAITRLRRTVSPYPKEDVRYVPTLEEDIQRYTAVTLDQIKSLYEGFIGSQAGELVIVGDFDTAECLKILRDTFAGWSAKQSYARIPRKFFPDVPGGLQQIITPDKANAVYAAGMAFSMKDTDPDYAALLMGNFVLGAGTLSSRLGDRVRQKDGLSYGVRSYLSADSIDPRASLTINAICNPKNIEKVNTAIGEELARLLADGVTPPELEKAKQGYLQQMQVARTSDSVLVATLADCLFADRTMAYYGDLEKKIAALTPQQVLDALRKYIDLKKLVIVDAGDFAPDSSANKGSAVK